MRVKICGITNLEDAFIAIDAGADALGFVFYPPSLRYIPPRKVQKIVAQLPPFITKVGLFVKTPPAEVNRIVREVGLDLAQLHWETDPIYWSQLEVPFLPVIRAKSPEDIAQFWGKYRLVDAFVEGYGGGGKRLNLHWFENVDREKIVLAGGLAPENLKEVVGMGFYGVDVSSGVEAYPGKKDPVKVAKFVEIAKRGK